MELTFSVPRLVKTRQEDLEDFSGPLDLILDLLRRNKIDIKDLRISLLLEQYLAWIEHRQSLDLEVASEFIEMASHLVYLKTRMLLSVDKEDEEINEFLLALEERQNKEKLAKISDGKSFLESKAELARSLFLTPRKSLPKQELIYSHSTEDLIIALRDIFSKAERRIPPQPSVFRAIAGREPYPVGDKITQILSWLSRRGRVFLKSVFSVSASKSELVAAFLAVLELCKGKKVTLTEKGEEFILESVSDEKA